MGRTALLSPFDRLSHDRKRSLELFGFEYTLEMYKPAAQRRWGYFALPVLHGDRLVGKVDAQADRKDGVLRVNAVHEDVPFTKAIRREVQAELDSLAGWLGLRLGKALDSPGWRWLPRGVSRPEITWPRPAGPLSLRPPTEADIDQVLTFGGTGPT